MKRAKSFAVEKFKGLLLAGSFTVLAGYVVRLSDSVVAGNLLGADALAGVNLVGPLLSIFSFVAGLISTGAATEYSLAMGRCDRTRARQFFMQALWSVALVGGALAAVVFFARGLFLDFFAASPAVTAHARAYLSWAWPLAVLEGLLGLVEALCYADGDARLCTIGYVVVFVVNVVVSVAGVTFGLGTGGCALGSIAAEICGLAVLMHHFRNPTNSFAPVRHFALGDTLRIVRASFGDAAAYLCDGLLFLFVNKFVIACHGSEVLPVVGVAATLWGFLELFNGIGVAVQPFVTVYYGEGNVRTVRTVMHAAMKAALGEGLALMILFGLFPSLVVRTVGLTDPALAEKAVLCVRAMCGGFVALAFAGLFNSYYMFVERALLAGTVTFLCYLVMPVACVASCGLAGAGGVWAGLALGPFLGIAVTSAIILLTSGRGSFPLLLSREREDRLRVFDLALNDFEIVAVSRRVAAAVSEFGGSDRLAARAALMTEEVFETVKDRAPDRRLLGEATLDFTDGVQLTLRDDGEIFDITDADQRIASLRTYLVASMMRRETGRLNLVTTGFNRNVFRFGKEGNA